jgi:hypothetical protein
VPANAKVTYADGSIFEAAARVQGPEIRSNFPQRYTRDLHVVEVFNPSMHWDFEGFARWEERHGIEDIREEPWPSIFGRYYLERGYPIFGTLVQFPVDNPELFLTCSPVLQRGVIVYGDGREDLFLRSYFHSRQDEENFVNFVPRQGIHMSFLSDGIWFPMALTGGELEVSPVPASYVVIDILTPDRFHPRGLPEPLEVVRSEAGSDAPEQMDYQGRDYFVTRIVGELSSTKDRVDLFVEA